MSNNVFLKCLTVIAENFGFEYNLEYSSMIYRSLQKKVSDDEIRRLTAQLCRECTAEEWNKSYGFRGKPPLADWLNYFAPTLTKAVDELYICQETGANLVRRKKITIEPNINQKNLTHEK